MAGLASILKCPSSLKKGAFLLSAPSHDTKSYLQVQQTAVHMQVFITTGRRAALAGKDSSRHSGPWEEKSNSEPVAASFPQPPPPLSTTPSSRSATYHPAATESPSQPSCVNFLKDDATFGVSSQPYLHQSAPNSKVLRLCRTIETKHAATVAERHRGSSNHVSTCVSVYAMRSCSQGNCPALFCFPAQHRGESLVVSAASSSPCLEYPGCS